MGGRWSEVSRWETDQTPFGCRRRRCGKRRRQLEATAQSSAWGARQRLGTADGGGRRRSTLAAGVVVCVVCRLSSCHRRMVPAPPAPAPPQGDGWWREVVSRQNRRIVLLFAQATAFFDRGKKEQSQKFMLCHHGKQSLSNIPCTPGRRLVEYCR